MATCQQCGGPTKMFTMVCPDCMASNSREADAILEAAKAEPPATPEAAAEAMLTLAAERLVLTTEMGIDLPVEARLGIVSGTCVFGQHVGRDFAAAWKDLVGGRAPGIERIFADARSAALSDMRSQAAALGADAVIAVQFTHQEMTGGGKSMVMVSVAGTAVSLARAVPD